MQFLDDPTDMLGGVVLHMAHIGLHRFKAEIGDRLAQFARALFVCGNLRLQIIDVLHHVPNRITRAKEKGGYLFFKKTTVFDDPEIVDINAFFFDSGRKRRHRTGCETANIGMMATRGDPEQHIVSLIIENRRADGNIGQMGAAIIRCVQHEHIARPDSTLVHPDNRFDGPVHRSEMNGHMGCVGDKISFRIEYSAGKIKPLFDIDGIGRVLKGYAHLFCNGHEQIIEDFEQDRIGLRPERVVALSCNDTC